MFLNRADADIAIPEESRRRLQRLAGILEIADQEFVTVRRELETYKRELPARLADSTDNVQLDGLSLHELLQSSNVCALDEAIAHAVDRPLSPEPFFPDYLLRLLTACSLSNAAAVNAGLVLRRAQVLAMAPAYIEFAARTWLLLLPELPRGYSLFFLAHAHVMDQGAHALDRVEHMTRVYHELDYPDDPAAARLLAQQLVALWLDSAQSS